VVQIEEIAKAAGVTQLAIEPGTPGPPPGGGDFSVVPITMSFEGTYEQLQDFLLRTRNLARLVTVNGVNYEEVEGTTGATVQEGIEKPLQVEIEAEVYFQPEGVPAGAAPAAPVPPETTTGETTGAP
jgi:type IV pilus assembly protein PilO